jgi:hypothetical protein
MSVVTQERITEQLLHGGTRTQTTFYHDRVRPVERFRIRILFLNWIVGGVDVRGMWIGDEVFELIYAEWATSREGCS